MHRARFSEADRASGTVTVLSLAAFVTGCEPANRTTEAERLQESTAKQFEAAQEATQDAIQAAGNSAEAQRTAFNDTREWLSEKIAPDQG